MNISGHFLFHDLLIIVIIIKTIFLILKLINGNEDCSHIEKALKSKNSFFFFESKY